LPETQFIKSVREKINDNLIEKFDFRVDHRKLWTSGIRQRKKRIEDCKLFSNEESKRLRKDSIS
jgi:hypothetical protein